MGLFLLSAPNWGDEWSLLFRHANILWICSCPAQGFQGACIQYFPVLYLSSFYTSWREMTTSHPTQLCSLMHPFEINLKFNQDCTVKGEGWNPEYTVTGTWVECVSVDFTQNFGQTCTYFTGTEMKGKITGKLGFQPNCLYDDFELNFCDWF